MTPAKSALLLLDPSIQTMRPTGRFGKLMDPATDFDGLTARLRDVLAHARSSHMLIVWVLPGAKFIAQVSNRITEPDELLPDETVGAPRAGEHLHFKESVGAFQGTGLAHVLQEQGITEVILAGVATQHVVAHTAREASDLGLDVRVIDDACADVDALTHSRALTALTPIATVVSVADLTAGQQ